MADHSNWRMTYIPITKKFWRIFVQAKTSTHEQGTEMLPLNALKYASYEAAMQITKEGLSSEYFYYVMACHTIVEHTCTKITMLE